MLMLQPTDILQGLWMFWIFHQGLLVALKGGRYISFQLVDMTNLIPSIGSSKRRRRTGSNDNLVKILESLIKVLLLLIDDADAKAHLIGSFKIRRDGQDG